MHSNLGTLGKSDITWDNYGHNVLATCCIYRHTEIFIFDLCFTLKLHASINIFIFIKLGLEVRSSVYGQLNALIPPRKGKLTALVGVR